MRLIDRYLVLFHYVIPCLLFSFDIDFFFLFFIIFLALIKFCKKYRINVKWMRSSDVTGFYIRVAYCRLLIVFARVVEKKEKKNNKKQNTCAEVYYRRIFQTGPDRRWSILRETSKSDSDITEFVSPLSLFFFYRLFIRKKGFIRTRRRTKSLGTSVFLRKPSLYTNVLEFSTFS